MVGGPSSLRDGGHGRMDPEQPGPGRARVVLGAAHLVSVAVALAQFAVPPPPVLVAGVRTLPVPWRRAVRGRTRAAAP